MISDDHRWCDIGACGNPDVHTPRLDRFAEEGMRFERYTTPAPMCAPRPYGTLYRRISGPQRRLAKP